MTSLLFGSTERELPQVEFTGDGREYFRIWVVNLALSVATLGIYSAWAKVRRLQYFYRHTRLAGAGFDFHGQPKAILRGRLVALTLLALYTVSGWVSPTFLLIVLAALAAVVPWLLSRSFRFRLRNTSYRGIRFGFTGTSGGAYWVFLGLPLLSVLSIFTLAPLWHHRMRRYQHANALYGRTPFRFTAHVGDFYLIYLALLGLAITTLFVIGGALLLISLFASIASQVTGAPRFDLFVLLPLLALYASVLLCLQAFAITRIQNLVWARTRLDQHAFVPSLEVGALFKVLWVNLFATVLTVGLFRPFAQVRLARYLTSAMALAPAGAIEDLTAGDAAGDTTAAGEEAAEFFNLDIAF